MLVVIKLAALRQNSDKEPPARKYNLSAASGVKIEQDTNKRNNDLRIQRI